MTNKEVLERGIPHEIEETLYHLLSDFWGQIKEYKLDNCSRPPVNLVTVYKNFLKEESMVDTTIYDKYHPVRETDIIDADFKEVETIREKPDLYQVPTIQEAPSLFGITSGIICQQVNCCGVMGAGLAKTIAEQFPQVKEAFDVYYRKSTNEQNKDYKCHFNQLGTQMLIPLDGRKVIDSKLLVANIYSQDFYGNAAKTGKVYTKLPQLINSIREIAGNRPDEPVYIPYVKGLDGKRDCGIGCGYGGESWERVYSQLQTLSEEYENLYLLDTNTCEVTRIDPLQIAEEKGENDYGDEHEL